MEFSSRILDLDFFHPGSGSRIQGSKSTESRIRIRNTGELNYTSKDVEIDL
jgi:hypothetical protein